MEANTAQAGSLLDSISQFCRQTQMAESTFGRRVVNDGKFVSRLRAGARITPETLARVNAFLSENGGTKLLAPVELQPLIRVNAPLPAPLPESKSQSKNFRFFDN